MLLTIGFIMLARLNFKSSIRQFIMVAVVSMLSLIVPFLMSRYDTWKSFTWIYCFVGIGLLTAVLLFGDKSKGAYLALKIGGFQFQPSEFVKIIFVFFVAGMLAKSTSFKHIVLSAIMACYHTCSINRLGKCLNLLYDLCIYGVCWNSQGKISCVGICRIFCCITCSI